MVRAILGMAILGTALGTVFDSTLNPVLSRVIGVAVQKGESM